MSRRQPLSKSHPDPLKVHPVFSKIYITVPKTSHPFHPFHPLAQYLAHFLNPFNPSQIPPHPSISDFNLPSHEDAIMYNNHRSRFLDESPRRERVSKRVPSMERMQVSLAVSPQVFPIPMFTSTTSTSTSTRMSTPELEGSEYLEPTLAESIYARRAESSVLDTAQFESEPWGYELYMGLQRGQTGGDARMVKNQPGAHRSFTSTPQYIESSKVYKAPLTAEEQEEREWRAREEAEKKETEEDDALMDSFDFEPTIRPYFPKYQSSFADRKVFSSLGRSI